MALQMFACTATQMCVMKVSWSVSGDADRHIDRSGFLRSRRFRPIRSPFRVSLCPVRISWTRFRFFSFVFRPGWKGRIIYIDRFDRSARDQRTLSADLVFIIINFFYFRKIRTFPRLESRCYSSATGIQCLETPTRVMLLSGYPQATRHPRGTSKEKNPRSFLSAIVFALIAVDDGFDCCHTPSSFDFRFLAWLFFFSVYAFGYEFEWSSMGITA